MKIESIKQADRNTSEHKRDPQEGHKKHASRLHAAGM